jgi:RNA polymerase sigma-B factor
MSALAQQPLPALLRVEDHLPLAYSIARRYRLQGRVLGVELVDLRQVAVLGLIRAARRFQPTRGARFSTFATLVVHQVSQDYLRRQEKLARAPRLVANDGDETDFFATVRAREHGSSGLDLAELINRLLAVLPRRELALVEARFGLRGTGPRTIAALAREQGVSRQRVSGLLLRAVKWMRREVRRWRRDGSGIRGWL